MAKLTVSIFTLNEGFPQLFDIKGDSLLAFACVGSNGEKDLYQADLGDGTYYIVNDECDEDTGRVTHRTLERVVIIGNNAERRMVAKNGEPVGDVPASVAEALNAKIGGPFATW